MIWFVTPCGEARPFLTTRKTIPKVGPLFSVIDGTLVFSAFMSVDEIKSMVKQEERIYFQRQIGKA